jgi:hypothetical protein
MLLSSVGLSAMERARHDVHAAQQDEQQAPGVQQKISNILKKFITAPWNFGAALTSSINNGTTRVEPATQVFMRCFLEGVMCGILLYLASGDAIADAANRRYRLANFALEDLLSHQPFHYTCSRLWIAFSGLKYFTQFLGLTGLRLYGLLFGTIIGLRCAYDGFFRLPISIIWGHPEERRRSNLFSSFRRDHDDD